MEQQPVQLPDGTIITVTADDAAQLEEAVLAASYQNPWTHPDDQRLAEFRVPTDLLGLPLHDVGEPFPDDAEDH